MLNFLQQQNNYKKTYAQFHGYMLGILSDKMLPQQHLFTVLEIRNKLINSSSGERDTSNFLDDLLYVNQAYALEVVKQQLSSVSAALLNFINS